MPDPSIFKDDTIIRELTSEEEQSLRKLLTEPAPLRPKSRLEPPKGERITATQLADALGGRVVARARKYLP